MSRIDDASTMLRTMKRLIALSFGTALPVDAQRTRFTCPRPFLLRPCERRLTVIVQRWVLKRPIVWLEGDFRVDVAEFLYGLLSFGRGRISRFLSVVTRISVHVSDVSFMTCRSHQTFGVPHCSADARLGREAGGSDDRRPAGADGPARVCA